MLLFTSKHTVRTRRTRYSLSEICFNSPFVRDQMSEVARSIIANPVVACSGAQLSRRDSLFLCLEVHVEVPAMRDMLLVLLAVYFYATALLVGEYNVKY